MFDLAPTVVLAAVCAMLATPLLGYAFTARRDAGRRRALTNLHRDVSRESTVLAFHGGGLAAMAAKLTSRRNMGLLDRLLARAGRPSGWPLERVLVVKIVSIAGVVALGALLLTRDPGGRVLLFVVSLGLLVWFLPELLLYNVGIKRRRQVSETLPDTLDQLTVAVDAGLGFESALAHVARNSHGPLADELVRTLQDIQVGTPRRTAYMALAERVAHPDLRRFLRSIIQAEQHGISVARVLTTQADEMRLKRRQRAEEQAMKIPVKVVFPLVLFILPALFVVIMGPAAITIIDAFSGR